MRLRAGVDAVLGPAAVIDTSNIISGSPDKAAGLSEVEDVSKYRRLYSSGRYWTAEQLVIATDRYATCGQYRVLLRLHRQYRISRL